MQVIGYKAVEFKPDEKTTIKGFHVYIIDEIDSKNVHAGYYSDKLFLSVEKFDAFKIKELYDSETPFTILYNRFGKVEKIIP